MKWTSTIKGIATFFFAVSVIGSLIIGFSVMKTSALLGIGIIVGGILVSVLAVGGVMILCEISENIYYMRMSLGGNSEYFSSSGSSLKYQKEKVSDGSWVCNCGARNNSGSQFCKSCGKERKAVSGNSSSKTTTWVCPKCGKSNPNSSRVCKDCSYEK